ncbi:hypothetical protein PGT21_003013 [Puccinia graminis f. sp. tritici]|uniref:Major facilitator superfamily (MFS) profile domain-containing protein n=1 Tax=Puccinia graminis f. sp. tritici TaxID=56615 RepID=A0A5B0MT09_PUCGR|nr:hypothetical protein PGT21_003013 [Puccinia graminis f. sp. tritici]
MMKEEEQAATPGQTMNQKEKPGLSDASTSPLERRALLKLDLFIIPMVTLCFFFSYLDRSNLGNVRIVGLQKDLQMSDYDFSMALTVTFIPYILVELPSMLTMRRVGAGIQIPLTVIIWGVVTFLHGFVKTYRGLLVARFFLGLVEGGLYPGLILYLSMFYNKAELQLRIGLFFSTMCLSGVVSGLLTYAIVKLDGRWGHPGWSWVFMIEGIVTTIFGIITLLFLPSSIKKTKFLTDEEKTILIARLERNNGSNTVSSTTLTERFPAKSTSQQVWEAFKSPHVIMLSAAQFASANNISSLAYFTPTIIHSFGYSPTATQLYSGMKSLSDLLMQI